MIEIIAAVLLFAVAFWAGRWSVMMPAWVQNTQRQGNEAVRYFRVKGTVNGEWHYMLLTEAEVFRGIERAESHPEDLR